MNTNHAYKRMANNGYGSEDFFRNRYENNNGDYLLLNELAVYRHHHAVAAQMIKPFFNATSSVLDIGCACGDIYQFIWSMNEDSKITGVDFVHEGLRVAHSRYPHADFCLARLPNLPFESGKFSIICCMEVLYYLENEQLSQLVGECQRVLRSKGTVLVSVNLANSARLSEQDVISMFEPGFFLLNRSYEHLLLYNKITKLLRMMHERVRGVDFLNSLFKQFRRSSLIVKQFDYFSRICGRSFVSNGYYLFQVK